MAQEGRGYLLIALWGLVVAGLLSALAAYLASLLIAVLVDMARDARYSMGPLIYAAPFYLAAAVMPFWGVKIFWRVLAVAWSDTEGRLSIRRSGLRLLKWSAAIYLGLATIVLITAWPDAGAEIWNGLAAMAAVGLFAVAPLILLLVLTSPISGGNDL